MTNIASNIIGSGSTNIKYSLRPTEIIWFILLSKIGSIAYSGVCVGVTVGVTDGVGVGNVTISTLLNRFVSCGGVNKIFVNV